MVDQLKNSEANARRIANVEACFGAGGRSIRSEDRVLVGEGVLVKLCRKKPKSRQFFLFNDILVYGSIIIPKKRYSKQHIIPLENVMLEDLDDEGENKNGWLIKTRTKSFVVYAATSAEKREWMIHIQRCIEALLNTGRQQPNNYAAVWIPDSEAQKCMCCQTSYFSVVNRRHHCRACGFVVCNGCSSKSFILEGISKKAVRVCEICYNKLCQGMSTGRPSVTDIQFSLDSSDSDDELHIKHLPSDSETTTFYESRSMADEEVLAEDKVVEKLI